MRERGEFYKEPIPEKPKYPQLYNIAPILLEENSVHDLHLRKKRHVELKYHAKFQKKINYLLLACLLLLALLSPGFLASFLRTSATSIFLS